MLPKHFILIIFTFFTTILYAENVEKPYGIPSGVIEYGIYGGGVVTPECNLTIEGTEKLSFNKWGQERIEEMYRIEILSGSLQSVEKEKTLKKSDHGTLYSVDFENERIIKSNLLEGDIGKIDLSHMHRSGMMNIASLDCDVWENDSRKVCIHKGIILLEEKSHLGFLYGKRAKSFSTDQNRSDDIFVLPDYPVKEDLLMRSMIKTTQTYKSETISDKINHAKEDIDPTNKKYHTVFNKFTKELFEKEKKYLPMLLKTMRQTRACLYGAENLIDANQCLYEIIDIKAHFNLDRDNELSIWVEETKEKILDDFDEGIAHLESKTPCINRSLNILDLSVCMKK